MADSPVLLRWKDHLHLSRMPMTKPSLHQQILPIESPSGSAFSFKSIIKLVPSNSTFVLVINWKKQRKYINWIRVRNYSNWKLKKGKKNIDLNVSAGKSFAPRQATTGKQNILFSSLTPDKANNSCLTLRRKEKEITLNYGNELLIS